MAADDDDLQPSPTTRRSRWEIKAMIAIVLVVLVGGGLWGALFGSPARRRAGIDSPNVNPYAVQATRPSH